MICPDCQNELPAGVTECGKCRPLERSRNPAPATGTGAPASAPAIRGGRTASYGKARSPFVGRADEIRHLESRWQQALESCGGVVVISGEAGIGKTRLTLELQEQARAQGAMILKFQGAHQHANGELHPLLEHLYLFAGVLLTDPEHVRYAKLEKMLVRSSPQIASPQLLECLAGLGRTPGRTDILQSPRQRREQMLEILVDGLCRMARTIPLLIVVDDAQWLDSTSVEALDRLVQQSATQRMLVLVTARREFVPSWVDTAQTSLIIPRRLNPADARALAASVSAAAALSPSQVQAIVERSEGVPLFIEEMARELATAGTAADAASPILGNIPALLTARLDRLGPAKRLAQIASAVGRRFSHEMANLVWAGGATEVEPLIEQLMAAEFLSPMPVAGGTLYAFRHSLVQEATYASQSPEERRQAHSRIVAALETDDKAFVTDQPNTMAYHCERAGLHLKAANYWLEAGKSSAARGSVAEAVKCFRLGIAAAEQMPDDSPRDQIIFGLNMNLGPALMALKGYTADDALYAFLKAKDALAYSRSSLELIHVYLGLFNAHFGRGQLDEALEVARQADQALSVGYGGYPVLIGQTLCMMGRFAEARAALEKALVGYDPAMDARSGLFCRADVVATSFLAKTEFALGNLDRSAELTRTVVDLARQQSHPIAIAIAHLGQLFMATELGDLALAQAISDEALDHVTKCELAEYRLWVLFHRAALTLRADTPGAIVAMERVLAETSAKGTLMFRSAQLGLLGAAYGSLGKHRDALSHIDDGIATALRTRGLEVLPALYRFRAKTLLDLKQPAEAMRYAEKSLSTAQLQSARIEELRSATMLARMLKDTDRYERALDRLAAVVATLSTELQLPDLKQAVRVLSSSGRYV